ncbi:MAG: hypothetical protein ABI669_09670, partial [Usitatibacter sp.]
ADRVDTYKPSNRFYVFPLGAGTKWNLSSLQQTGDRKFELKVRLRVFGEEEVDTPSGKVRAIRIERESRWKQRGSDAAGVNLWTYWYTSAAKRFVRAQESTVTSDGKVLSQNRHELVSYSVK